ncbi:MAG: hypothetical protein NT128_07910 [Proteobacteria bacterium]|nr:hypothetical protein [Pseudomonadota bacterium]
MKKFIRKLLSVSLTTACFASWGSEVNWDYLQPNYVSRNLQMQGAIATSGPRDIEGVLIASDGASVGSGSPFSSRFPGLITPDLPHSSRLFGATMAGYIQNFLRQPKCLRLKTFQEFKNEEGVSVENALSMRLVERHFPKATLEISHIIAQYGFESVSNRPFKVYAKERLGQLIDGYWKYLSNTVKEYFASSNQPRSIHYQDDGVDGKDGVKEIAKALGTTALLKLEEMRAQHKHLSHSTMSSRLLTNHVNDLAQEHGFRQKLEFNHEWAIEFRESFMQRVWGACIVYRDTEVSEGFGEDFYRQPQAYYQSNPILRQVLLNPNRLPQDVELQFIRYFWKMYWNSLKQLR